MIQSWYHLEEFLFPSLNSFFSMSEVQIILFAMSAVGAFLSIAFLFSAVHLQSVLLIFSWIHIIIKLTTVCSLFSQSLMLSGVCWRLLKNAVPYLLYWQGEVWSFSVVHICKVFPSLLLTGPFLPLKFPHRVSLLPNTVLSYHCSSCFNFCFQCRSVYLIFQSLLEFSAFSYVSSVLSDTTCLA